MSLNLILGES
jgi:hypothetical protein